MQSFLSMNRIHDYILFYLVLRLKKESDRAKTVLKCDHNSCNLKSVRKGYPATFAPLKAWTVHFLSPHENPVASSYV